MFFYKLRHSSIAFHIPVSANPTLQSNFVTLLSGSLTFFNARCHSRDPMCHYYGFSHPSYFTAPVFAFDFLKNKDVRSAVAASPDFRTPFHFSYSLFHTKAAPPTVACHFDVEINFTFS